MPETFRITLPDDIIASLDDWIANEEDPKPSREDAILTALCEWLAALGQIPADRCSILGPAERAVLTRERRKRRS